MRIAEKKNSKEKEHTPMRIVIQSNYLIFPTYTHAAEKKLVFSRKGKAVLELALRLDHSSPDFFAYIDVSLFKNEILELSVSPEMPIGFSESDELPSDSLCREPIRPQTHFTVKNGWMGAPLALIVSEGKYVLQYPFNPADIARGNAHWGYAVSDDLIHWKEARTAFPPENGEEFLSSRAKASLKEQRELRFLGEWARTDDFTLADETGARKWVRFTEGGSYLIGDMKNGVFMPTQQEKRLCYGDSDCAGITLEQENGRVIRMPWDSCKTARFCGQMGIAAALSLEKLAEDYALAVLPIEELQTLYKNTNIYKDTEVSAERTTEIALADSAHWIRIKEIAEKAGVLTVILFGREIRLDFDQNRICVCGKECPLSVSGGDLDLSILVDRMGMEFFADGGRIYMSALTEETFMDRNLLTMGLCSDTENRIGEIEMHSLESIW